MTTSEATQERSAPVTRIGVVTSDKRNKTITVEVRNLFKHPQYGKYIYRSTMYHAHDEKNEAKQGDRVEIIYSRPISKQKRWRLTKILTRAAVVDDVVAGAPEQKAKKEPKSKPAKAKGKSKDAKDSAAQA